MSLRPFLLLFFLCGAQPKSPAQEPHPVDYSAAANHAQMTQQLGIAKLRPGRDSQQDRPNAANYDESTATPFERLPDPLALKDGGRVATADQWRRLRRPEIVDDFEREIVGRAPDHAPLVEWQVRETREAEVGGAPVIEKRLVGVVDNSDYPAIEVNIEMSLTTPKAANRPVPVLMMFGQTPFEQGRRNFFGTSRQEDLAKAGWGYALINPWSVQADNGEGLTRGVIGLVNKGRRRKPEDWGALRAWAWGASRGLDYLKTDPNVDPQRVGIEGVSRYGKAALTTMALDTRFAMVLVGSSGKGGATLYRRNFGEAVENLTGVGEHHWMAGNFLKYGAEEAGFGRSDASDLPIDSHEVIALCAPRLTFISYGVPEQGDSLWLDQRGSYMATVAAGQVFRLLGAGDLGVGDDYLNAKLPPVGEGLLDGKLAWRQHRGGHTDGPNMSHFIQWAERLWCEAASSPNPPAE
ncbi:MAG: hypothetical protein KDA37_06880 [Planctomycetales bacterium]|nr:hypothetical protein [Planctomycetales bacterium]